MYVDIEREKYIILCYYCDCCCIYPDNPFFSCLAGNEMQKEKKNIMWEKNNEMLYTI